MCLCCLATCLLHHNTTYLQEQGTDSARCVAFKGVRGCKIHAFCFEICQGSCFLFLSETSFSSNAPQLCWSFFLYLISQLLNACLTERHLMWGLDSIHLWLTVSSAVCPSQSVSSLIMFAFEMSQIWTSGDAQPTQILHMRSHHTPSTCFQCSVISCVDPGGQGWIG